jgi:hypothetical protein
MLDLVYGYDLYTGRLADAATRSVSDSLDQIVPGLLESNGKCGS